MRIRLESVKKIGRKIGINDEKGYAVAIFLALIIISSVVIGYYVVLKPQPEGYNTIYLLDSQKKAIDYPEVLVANLNSTFNVFVNVENHMGGKDNQTYQVLVKITPNLSGFPVDTQPIKTYDVSFRDGDSWQNSASITENLVGSYSVVFELWQYKDGTLEFTHNNCVLNIQVIN